MPPRRRASEPPPLPFPFTTAGGSLPQEELAELEGTCFHEPVWMVLTYAHRWLSTPADELPLHGGETPEIAGLPSELRTLVGRMFELFRSVPRIGGTAEEPPTHEMIALGLAAIGDWMEKEEDAGHVAAVAYQLAALFLPGKPGLSYYLGRALRRTGRRDEAEAWLRYAAARAREIDAGEHEARAYCCLGNMERERANAEAARRHYRASLRAARKHALRVREGNALYGLAVLAFERHDLSRGMAYAREAIEAYGPGHAELVRLTHDIAWIWMHLHGRVGFALQLFYDIEPTVQDPAFRGLLLANIVRAAAELGREEAYEAMWLDAYEFLMSQRSEVGRAAALAELALGSLAAMQPRRAHAVAVRAHEVAVRRRERQIMSLASQIMAATEDGNMPDVETFAALFPGFARAETTRSPTSDDPGHEFIFDLGQAAGRRARTSAGAEGPMHALVYGN